MSAYIISAFPGTGKTHFYKQAQKFEGAVLDSDSSTFPKDGFPANYIAHIKSNMPSARVILVSSHKDVREALVAENITFNLVYPDISLKDEYIKRYKERGSPEGFIKLLTNNWEMWINELEAQTGCRHFKLYSGEYLMDILK